MQALLRANMRFQHFSNKFVDYVFCKGCIHGNKLQEYVMNSSDNTRQILQLFARLPLLFAIHLWFLLGPNSENSMLWSPCFIIRLLVGYEMARAWIFNIKSLIPFYMLIFIILIIAMIEESFYWTVQNDINNVCHVSILIPWVYISDAWLTTVLSVILIETTYYWIQVYSYTYIQHSSQIRFYGFTFILFIITYMLPVFGILPYIMSTTGYFINKVRLAVTLINGISKMEAADVTFDKISFLEEARKCLQLEGEALSKAKQRKAFLQERLRLDRIGANVMNNFANNKGVRDIFFIFGTLYFWIALILELNLYGCSNISDSVFFNSLCKFIIRWSISIVPVLTISFFLCFLDRIVTGLSVWLVTWEITFTDAINIDIDNRIIHFTFLTLLMESGIPTFNTDLDIKSVVIISVLMFYFILQKAVEIPARKIIEISNRSSDLTMWFYLRVCIAFLILFVVPVVLFPLFVSKIYENSWSLFFASGNVILILNIIFFVIEWILVSLTWYADQYLSVIEHSIQCIQCVKECSYVVFLPLQFYARYSLSVFRAWWILRASNLIFNYVVLLFVFIFQRKKEYDYNKKLLRLLNGLSDVSYAPFHATDHIQNTCSICFSSIRKGKELPCMHVFHKECLRRWFKVRTVCPTCNLPLA